MERSDERSDRYAKALAEAFSGTQQNPYWPEAQARGMFAVLFYEATLACTAATAHGFPLSIFPAPENFSSAPENFIITANEFGKYALGPHIYCGRQKDLIVREVRNSPATPDFPAKLEWRGGTKPADWSDWMAGAVKFLGQQFRQRQQQ